MTPTETEKLRARLNERLDEMAKHPDPLMWDQLIGLSRAILNNMDARPTPAGMRKALEWIRDQRWSDNADLDEICARAEAALSAPSAPDEGERHLTVKEQRLFNDALRRSAKLVGTGTPPEPSLDALREALAETVTQLIRRADVMSSLLEHPNWRATRSHIEDARNAMRQAAKQIDAALASPPSNWVMVDDMEALPDDLKPEDEIQGKWMRGCIIITAYRRSGGA